MSNALDIDVPREVLGEPVEHGIDARLIAFARRLCAEFRKKRGARIVGCEEAVDVTARDAAIGRRRAVGTAIGERDERSRDIGSGCFADVHFVAFECGTGSRQVAFDGRQRFFGAELGLDVEKPEALDRARPPFDAVRIGDTFAEHLIAAAETEHASAAAHVGADVDVPSFGAQRREIVDRRFRPGE